MSPLYDDVTDITEEYYDKVSAVNLKGPFALSLRLGGHGRARRRRDPQHLDRRSIRTSRRTRSSTAWPVGLNAMTVALADAFGPKVRVNCILPGAILTDISKAWSEETKANAAKTPMGRAGYAEDFPGAALFFASEARRGSPARACASTAGRPPAGRDGGVDTSQPEHGERASASGGSAGLRGEGSSTTSSGCSPTTPPSSGCPTTDRRRSRREVARSTDRRLSALVWGTEPPELVLLHGGAQNAHTWDTVAMALGRPLVAIDLPGHGHSDGGRGGSSTSPTTPPTSPSSSGAGAGRPAVVGMRSAGSPRASPTATRARPHGGARRHHAGVDGGEGQGDHRLRQRAGVVPSFDELLSRHDGVQPDPLRGVAATGHPHNALQQEDGIVGVALPPLHRQGGPRRTASDRRRPTCGTPSRASRCR